jgi:hypothetical protein
VYYCNKCGSLGASHLSNLAKACTPPGIYGNTNLKYIRSGVLPPKRIAVFKAVRAKSCKHSSSSKVSKGEGAGQVSAVDSTVSPMVDCPQPLNTKLQAPLLSFDDPEGDFMPGDDEFLESLQDIPAPYTHIEQYAMAPSANSGANRVVPYVGYSASASSSSLNPNPYPYPVQRVTTAPALNLVSLYSTAVSLPAQFCQECGDSLSTAMHISNGGPCGLPRMVSPNIHIPEYPIQDYPRNICIPAYSAARNLECVVCGDSLSTAMHVNNGPCT